MNIYKDIYKTLSQYGIKSATDIYRLKHQNDHSDKKAHFCRREIFEILEGTQEKFNHVITSNKGVNLVLDSEKLLGNEDTLIRKSVVFGDKIILKGESIRKTKSRDKGSVEIGRRGSYFEKYDYHISDRFIFLLFKYKELIENNILFPDIRIKEISHLQLGSNHRNSNLINVNENAEELIRSFEIKSKLSNYFRFGFGTINVPNIESQKLGAIIDLRNDKKEAFNRFQKAFYKLTQCETFLNDEFKIDFILNQFDEGVKNLESEYKDFVKKTIRNGVMTGCCVSVASFCLFASKETRESINAVIPYIGTVNLTSINFINNYRKGKEKIMNSDLFFPFLLSYHKLI